MEEMPLGNSGDFYLEDLKEDNGSPLINFIY